MEGVDHVIEGVDVRPSFYRTGPWARLVLTVPLSSSTAHTVHTNTDTNANTHAHARTHAHTVIFETVAYYQQT